MMNLKEFRKEHIRKRFSIAVKNEELVDESDMDVLEKEWT